MEALHSWKRGLSPRKTENPLLPPSRSSFPVHKLRLPSLIQDAGYDPDFLVVC